MDTELILAIVGIVFAVVAFGALSVARQARLNREKREKVAEAETASATAAPLGRFFVACYRGRKARFYRVYPDEDAFLFIDAGPFLVLIDADTVRGSRHWTARAGKLLVAGLAAGAAAGGLAVFLAGRGGGDGSALYAVLGLAALLTVGFAVALPAAVWRIALRGVELNALSPDGLRAEADAEPSFRADHGTLFDIAFAPLDGGGEVGATLTFRHKPTGKWTIETTTTRDTRAALDAFYDAFGDEIMRIDEGLRERLDWHPESDD